MSKNKRSLWLSLSLANLCIVALFGMTLRSKILFPLHFIDYRNFLSAHSHFAFSGWVGLGLITLLIYDLLPPERSSRKIYQRILLAIEISSLGMAVLFPFIGYTNLTIVVSSIYIFASFVFAGVYIKDILRTSLHPSVRLLSVGSICSLVISAVGPAGLLYIILAKSGNSLLYRNSIYTFLHFQYNGFFTLAVFALWVNFLTKKGLQNKTIGRFAVFLCLSIVPSLFLSLLWFNKVWIYVLAAIGCLLILVSLVYFIRSFRIFSRANLLQHPLSHALLVLSASAFAIKMALHMGTIFPSLGNAVYGDRPVIIGFLHLVFLAFVTFYMLSNLIESDYFTRHQRVIRAPFLVFAAGVIVNETFLMLQGLSVLLETNSDSFKWLLWGASILLFLGALLVALARFSVVQAEKKKP